MSFRPVIKKINRNPQRVLLLDGDIIAYDVAYKVTDDQVENMYIRADLKIKACMDIAECGGLEVHLTGSRNFRNKVANIKQYKGNRYHPDGSRKVERPQHLPTARKYLANKYSALISNNEEADDTMSYRSYDIMSGQDEIYTEAVLGTSDKDIGSNSGIYMNIMYDTVDLHKGFGEIELNKAKTKVKGWGLKFFCAQLLMGDPTDNIPGLPKTPEIAKTLYGCRLGGLGPAKAFTILESTKNYKEAMAIVRVMYKDYANTHIKDAKITTWRGDTIDYTWNDLLKEQGRLLWMRQSRGELWNTRKDYAMQERAMWDSRKKQSLQLPVVN